MCSIENLNQDVNLLNLLTQAIDTSAIVKAKQPLRRKTDGKPSCYYCGQVFGKGRAKDIDHITPTKLGGVNAAFNKAIVCSHCNYTKNSKHPVYWLMEGNMDMSNQQSLDLIARILYHYLTVTPTNEPAF